MRYVLIIGDGIADRPVAPLGGKTPLEALALPGMARLASQRMGLARTVPEGVAPGSDTAILSIFGCDPRTCYTGRAALEAAGAGVTLRQGETCWRVNLATVEGDEFAGALMRSHNGWLTRVPNLGRFGWSGSRCRRHRISGSPRAGSAGAG